MIFIKVPSPDWYVDSVILNECAGEWSEEATTPTDWERDWEKIGGVTSIRSDISGTFFTTEGGTTPTRGNLKLNEKVLVDSNI